MEIDYHYLQTLISHLDPNRTYCIDTVDDIISALNDMMGIPNTLQLGLMIFGPSNNKSSTLLSIKSNLCNLAYLSVGIDYFGIEHSFILCNTDHGTMIIDSFIDIRGASVRPFDIDRDLGHFWNMPASFGQFNSVFLTDFDDEIIYTSLDNEAIYTSSDNGCEPNETWSLIFKLGHSGSRRWI